MAYIIELKFSSSTGWRVLYTLTLTLTDTEVTLPCKPCKSDKKRVYFIERTRDNFLFISAFPKVNLFSTPFNFFFCCRCQRLLISTINWPFFPFGWNFIYLLNNHLHCLWKSEFTKIHYQWWFASELKFLYNFHFIANYPLRRKFTRGIYLGIGLESYKW